MLRVLGDMRDLVERYGVPASDKAAVADVQSQGGFVQASYSLGRGQAGLVSLYEWADNETVKFLCYPLRWFLYKFPGPT